MQLLQASQIFISRKILIINLVKEQTQNHEINNMKLMGHNPIKT